MTIIDEFTRECLAIDVAGSIGSKRVIEVFSIIEGWRRHYNAMQPHSSLGCMTPHEFKQQHNSPTPGRN